MEAPGQAIPGKDERPIALIKLGGSVLTRKRETEKLRPKVLARLAREVAQVHSHQVVLLHGAGGFGHPGAARFGLARAPTDDHPASERGRGASIVSAEVRRLHLAVLRELVRVGARPWSVPLAGHALQTEGRLVSLESSAVVSTLARGQLPVSFGDVVPDTVWGTSILSADTIAVELARTLHPEVVLFVSDVDGIYAPGSVGRRARLPVVDPAVVRSLEPASGVPDVTGGIRGKAKAMLAIAGLGVDAGLISGLSDGAIPRALQRRGRGEDGSWALAGESGDAR